MSLLYILLFLVSSDFPICEYPEFQEFPCVIYTDSLYCAFWSDMRIPVSIYGARIQPNGVVLDTTGRFLFHGNTTFGARAAYDGQNMLVVFRDSC